MKNKHRRFPQYFCDFKKVISVFLVTLTVWAMLLPVVSAYADQPEQPGIEVEEVNNTASENDSTDSANNPTSEGTATENTTGGSPGSDTMVAPMAVTIPELATISSSINTDMVFDIPGGSANNEVRVQLYSNNKTPAQRFQFIANNDGTYTIKNVNSGKVLDVKFAWAYDGAIVWQYAANGSDAQKWYISEESNGYKISSKLNSGYCLDVPGAWAVTGAVMQLYSSNGTAAQRFRLNAITRTLPDGAYYLNTAVSSRVLDIMWASSANGTVAWFYDLNYSLAQRFVLAYDPQSGYYTITNVQSNKVLDVDGAARNNGSKVQIYQANGTYAQKWEIASIGNSQYRITAAHSGLSLAASSANTINGTPAQTFEWANANAQKWQFTPTLVYNEGAYVVRSRLGTVIDAKGNGWTSGTPIWAYQSNGTTAQKFYLQHVADGYFTLECMNSGLVVSAQGTSVVIMEDRAQDYQLWKLTPAGEGRFLFVNKSSGQALDIQWGNAASGTSIQTYAVNNTNAQQWTFEVTYPIVSGLFRISSMLDLTKVLDIRNNSSSNGAKLQLYESNGTVAQVFQITPATYPNSYITCLNSNKALDVTSGSLSPKGVVQLWDANPNGTNPNQIWRLEYVGKGHYRIYTVLGNGNYCLTVEGSSTVNSTDVNAYPVTYTPNQVFRFTSLGNTAYVPLRMTVSQMVQYQRSNPYINNITDQQLFDVIDPATTVNDYSFPNHSQYRNGLYQFADLRGYTGMSAAQIDSIIQAYAPSSSNLFGTGYAFVQAAKTYNVNECYLLAHCALETGWGTSALAKNISYDGSEIDGVRYPAGTYYNFFGIGAVDSSPYSGGASYAIRNGWNTIERAITGGAKWIAEGYVHRNIYNPPYAQPTLYAMKWDYNRSTDIMGFGWHQYATDHLWARKIARMMGDFYSQTGVKPNLTYIIPLYAR